MTYGRLATRLSDLQDAPGVSLQGLLSPDDSAALSAFCFFNFVQDLQGCIAARSQTLPSLEQLHWVMHAYLCLGAKCDLAIGS